MFSFSFIFIFFQYKTVDRQNPNQTLCFKSTINHIPQVKPKIQNSQDRLYYQKPSQPTQLNKLFPCHIAKLHTVLFSISAEHFPEHAGGKLLLLPTCQLRGCLAYSYSSSWPIFSEKKNTKTLTTVHCSKLNKTIWIHYNECNGLKLWASTKRCVFYDCFVLENLKCTQKTFNESEMKILYFKLKTWIMKCNFQQSIK